jgi:Iap family predicted aminopeptidase
LDGARAFARQHSHTPNAPALLSVDMVGSGSHLRIFNEVRAPRRTRTSPALNQLLKRADPAAVDYTAIGRSGDFVEFVRAGCQATGIEASGTPDFWRAYHTLHDRPDQLDPAAMQRACEMLLRAIELIEQGQ